MLLSQTNVTRTNDYVAPYQRAPFQSPIRSSESVPPFFAGELAMAVIKTLRAQQATIMEDGSTDPDFYTNFYQDHKNLFLSRDIVNRDLALIYSKQIMILLKKEKLVLQSDGKLDVNGAIITHTLRHNLFFAFWNKCDWKELFPSVPEYADVLFRHRLLLVEEILCSDKPVSIDQLTDEFLLESGARCDDELLFVSYLDFTVLTWLSHFGFITFSKGSSYDKVMLALTDAGRNAFRLLLQNAARHDLSIN